MILKNKYLISSVLIILFIFIILPSTFALDNQTDIDESLSINQDDLLGDEYYFDSSNDNEGNGSETNPYNSLSNDKLVENSVIHLKNGEYELNKGKSISSISIIGEDCENTIVKFQNNNSILTNTGKLTLQNLTLVDVSIINYGTVNATNVIFKNSIAYLRYSEGTNLVNYASNSFGGAIYSPKYESANAHVYLDNCTFYNNTAEYGGAIYMYEGVLNIKNSLFLDNVAYNYGGAIACEYNSKAIIENTRFINSRSLNDAGGAIYLKSTKFTGENINITNSQSTFGGAITSLNSNLVLNRLNLINNTANYEGGAIYQFYGSFTLRNSNLINNSAKNGGALFLDNTTSLTLYKNIFTNNTALDYGGAIYSLLNLKIRDNFNEYEDNKANIENDIYLTDTVSMIIGSGNYSMYKFNPGNFTQIPNIYSSLENGFVTSVKDQQSGGNCWAFAGLAVLESCILKASGDNLDLSEENMKNLMELYSDYGWYMDTNSGGFPSMIMAYLVSWMGPVLEQDDINDDYSTLSPLLNSIMHVQNVKYIKRSNFSDISGIKQAILDYGAVGTGIYYDASFFNNKTSSYYCSVTTSTNHAVTIVGWDDNYSKDNFIYTPRGDGAFIVKNSWNTDWGDEGFFYVSYYDTSFARIGDSESIYTFILNDTVKFDKNYQYDIIGKTDYLLTPNNEVWYQNIFESQGEEYLAAVSTYFEKECEWNLSIYVNDVLKLVKTGFGDCGYYTIDLGEYIHLNAGDVFKIVFKITANEASFPISEKVSSNKVLYKSNVSFFSDDGINWIDLYNYSSSYASHYYSSQVACIKAFTFNNIISSDISLNISDKGYNPTEIVASVVNQYGNPVTGGNVTFKINSKEYVVPVANGLSKLVVDLDEMAVSHIEAEFSAVGYLASASNATVNITKKTAVLDLNVSQFTVTTTIEVSISKQINETILIQVNNMNYTAEALNGNAIIVLDNLESNNYTISASILNDDYANTTAVKEVEIDVKSTMIVADDLIKYYNGDNECTVRLIDENDMNVSNREIIFTIDGKRFSEMTDENGSAIVNVTLPVGKYCLDISFSGDEKFINSSKRINITVLPTVNVQNHSYTLNSKYQIQFLDRNGNPLNNTKVSAVLKNKVYNQTTDNNGICHLTINLAPGKYNITTLNPDSTEEFTAIINVIPRITSNKGLTMYFGSESSYKVRIVGDDGKYVKAGEKVKITIAGKSYTVKTNKNGYASFKINLASKNYTITATYKGYKVSNKIVVKPVLTAKNISKKKAKKIKFSAKLVSTKGKPLKGKKITFKIKNKKYFAKTNKKGVATITLKNLKVGKYTISTKYGKSTIKNSIKIKK